MLTKIRPIRREDLSSVLSWRNHPDVRQYMYTQQEIAWEEHLAWFESVCARDNSYVMIFENDGIPSGVLNINIVSKSDKRAEWGFYLSPMAAKGSGSLLGSQACEFVFESLGLHKLCGEVLAYNHRSIKFHERLGFKQEAILREHHCDGSRYHDVIGFGLLAAEWKVQRRT